MSKINEKVIRIKQEELDENENDFDGSEFETEKIGHHSRGTKVNSSSSSVSSKTSVPTKVNISEKLMAKIKAVKVNTQSSSKSSSKPSSKSSSKKEKRQINEEQDEQQEKQQLENEEDEEEEKEEQEERKTRDKKQRKRKNPSDVISSSSLTSNKKKNNKYKGGFEATLSDASVFKKIIESFVDLLDLAEFQLSEEGITAKFMDSSHVSLCSMKLDRSDFSSFQYERNMCMGVDLKSLLKTISSSTSSSYLTLNAINDSDNINISITSKKNEKKRFNAIVKKINIEQDSLDIPIYVPEWHIEMAVADYKVFKDFSQQPDIDMVRLVVKENYLRVVGGSKTQGRIDQKIPAISKPQNDDMDTDNTINDNDNNNNINDNEDDQDNENNEPKNKTNNKIKLEDAVYVLHNKIGLVDEQGEMRDPVDKTDLTFALRYLVLFGKASPLCSTGRVIIHMDEIRPIMIQFPILSGKSFIKFFLAPKMADDEQEILSDSDDDDEQENNNNEDDEYDV